MLDVLKDRKECPRCKKSLHLSMVVRVPAFMRWSDLMQCYCLQGSLSTDIAIQQGAIEPLHYCCTKCKDYFDLEMNQLDKGTYRPDW